MRSKMFKALHDFDENHPLRLYRVYMEDAVEKFSTSYRRIAEARTAYDNEMPDSMRAQHSVKPPAVNGSETGVRSSTYFPPYVSSTIDLRSEAMLANLPTLSYYITDPAALPLREAIDQKVKDIYTLGNLSQQIHAVYQKAEIDGICVSQVVCKPALEKVVMSDGAVDSWETGRYIDIQTYDSLGVFFDPNANSYDIRGTAEWAVVTLGFFDSAYIAQKYGLNLATMTAVHERNVKMSSGLVGRNAYGAQSSNINDMYIKKLEVAAGVFKPEAIPVREFYLKDGSYYTVVADNFVVTDTDANYNSNDLGGFSSYTKYANNGSCGKLPLIFTVLCPSPNGLLGTSLHHKLEPTISPIAALMNLVLDGTFKNLNAPLYTNLTGLEDTVVPFHKQNNVIQVTSMEKGADMQKAFFQPSYSMDPASVERLLSELKTLLNMITRTPDIAYGFQDKQIRNEAAANLLGSSMLRNSSFLVTMFEFTFMSQFAKDVIRCFYKYFDHFGPFFYEDEGVIVEVKREQLKKIQSVHVENGSTLETAQITRLGKAQALLQLLGNPSAVGVMKHKQVLREFLDALGVEARTRFIKSAEEIVAELQTSNDLPKVANTGG